MYSTKYDDEREMTVFIHRENVPCKVYSKANEYEKRKKNTKRTFNNIIKQIVITINNYHKSVV